MNAYDVGADVGYRDVAIQAVTSAYHQRPSQALGYLRTGVQQKVYLFGALDDARAWYDSQRGLLESGDYAAVFAGTNLHSPIAENFGSAVVSGHDPAEVGSWFLPFALGLPAGGLGGYYYRKWQEAHPGRVIPWISGDIVGAVDHLTAAPHDEYMRRRAWPQTKALIQSAVREVLDSSSAYPAEAYVWSLEAPSVSSRPGVELYGTTTITPFASHDQALDYMRDRIQTDHVALALFDRRNPHWPNPVNWNKSNDPSHEPVIAQQIAKYAHGPSARAAGEVGELVGSGPWYTIVGAALDLLRRQAKAAAQDMPGRVIGTRRDASSSWQLKSFHSTDDADDWFGHAVAEPAAFTYAAYFSKDANGIPYLENEAIGGARTRSITGPPIPREIATVTVRP